MIDQQGILWSLNCYYCLSWQEKPTSEIDCALIAWASFKCSTRFTQYSLNTLESVESTSLYPHAYWDYLIISCNQMATTSSSFDVFFSLMTDFLALLFIPWAVHWFHIRYASWVSWLILTLLSGRYYSHKAQEMIPYAPLLIVWDRS